MTEEKENKPTNVNVKLQPRADAELQKSVAEELEIKDPEDGSEVLAEMVKENKTENKED